jgi:ubiquinone/menaquinone biosynthesis C-methylase UbiE
VAAVSDRWAVGAAYEAYMGRWSRPLARAFVEWLAPAPRAHWLDVGCGTGALTAAICDIGKPASVVACDPSGPFLEAASSTLPDKRVSFELATAERLPEREGGFDAIVSGLLLNFVPDMSRALTAMRERLGPRGIVAAYVWDYVEGMQFLRRFWEVAVALDPHAANLDESKRFSFCNAEELVARFRGAGFGKVDTERAQVVTDFASFDEYWGPFLGRTGPAPSYVASLDPAQRDRLRDALRERLEPAPGGHLSLTASAWMVRGMPAQ